MVPLHGSLRQTAKWSQIAEVLRWDYSRDPTAVLREYQRLLDKYDVLDAQEAQLLERIKEYKKSKRRGVKRLEARLNRARKERKKLERVEQGLRNLGLKRGRQKVGGKRPRPQDAAPPCRPWHGPA